MNRPDFTERVRKVLTFARNEAARRRMNGVGTEHLLFGILAEKEGVAASVIYSLQIDPERITKQLEAALGNGSPGAPPKGSDMPFTSRANNALEHAVTEANELKHAYLGTEHLLLGLLREEHGDARKILNAVGLTLNDARIETLRMLGDDAPVRQHSDPTPKKPIASLALEVRFTDGTSEAREFPNIGAMFMFLSQRQFH